MRLIKQLAIRVAATVLRPDSRIARGQGRYVLCYHRVIGAQQARDEWVHDSMWVSPESFEAQILWMKSVGEVVSLDRLLDFDTPSSTPLFAVTFDDGWRDNLVHALPVMQRHGVEATIFIATACMDRGALLWPEDLAVKTASIDPARLADLGPALVELSPGTLPEGDAKERMEAAIEQLKQVAADERTFRIHRYYTRMGLPLQPAEGHMLNWREAAELLAAGVRLESHSHSHRIFSEASGDEVVWELEESRERIRRELGHVSKLFAYPNARYRGTEGPALSQLGYKYAFRIHNLPARRDSDPHYIPRFIVSEGVWRCPDLLKLQLLGVTSLGRRTGGP